MEALLIIIVAILGGIALIAGLILYGAMAYGYVTMKFYAWFALPLFPMLPQLSYWQCVGITMLLMLFKGNGVNSTPSDCVVDEAQRKKLKAEESWKALLSPWLMLLLGWIVLQAIEYMSLGQAVLEHSQIP